LEIAPVSEALDEAYRALNPDQPLRDGEASPFYVDFSSVRGGQLGDLVSVVMRRIRRAEQAEKQIVTGHRGCGKSTELHRLRRHLESDGYFVVYVDVETGLDLNDVDYPDIYLAVAKEVVKQINANSSVQIDAKVLRSVEEWFQTQVTTWLKSSGRDVNLGVKAEGGADYAFGALFKLLATFQAGIRASDETRTEIRKVLEPQGSTLIGRVNDLIRDANARLAEAGGRGLVLILDGLEKVIFKEGATSNSHEMLFVHHGEQLKAIECHTIYTMPISLLSSRNVGQIFTQQAIIPMVKTTHENGRKCEEGRSLLRKAILARIGTNDIFEDPALLDPLVVASGGHLRDLLRLLRYAIDLTDKRISRAHVEKAISDLTNEYDRLIRDSDLPCLVEVHSNHLIPGTAEAGLLLFNLLVLEYQNGERWADVHPCILRTRKFKLAAKDPENGSNSDSTA
jgi:hypothetical protein